VAIQKALSRGAPGDATEVLTISDSEVDNAMDSDDISEYSLQVSNPSDVDPLPEPTRRKDKGKGKATVAPTNPELSEPDDLEIIQFTASSSTSNAFTIASTDPETGNATAAQSQSGTTPRVFTDLGSDFESDLGTMLPVIGTQTVTPAGSLVSIPLVSLLVPTDILCTSHAGPNWIEAPCVRGIWGQRISDLGLKRSCQWEQADQI
jgi:hypothetical protein